MTSEEAQKKSAEEVRALLHGFHQNLFVDAVPLVYGVIEQDTRLDATAIKDLIEAATDCECLLRNLKDRLMEALTPRPAPLFWNTESTPHEIQEDRTHV